ncbi:MAG: DsbA family protein [Acidobacteriaceae bacterium]
MKRVWTMQKVQGMKTIAWVLGWTMAAVGACGRAQTPKAPEMSPATAEAQQVTEPQAPAPHTAPTNPFPPVNLKNFTANSPTVDEVNAFLKEQWGYDTDQTWSVAAILKTSAPGVTRVVVFTANKNQPGKMGRVEFFITPDGKHLISGGVMDFGPHPYAARRMLLQQQAQGPVEGAASNALMVVEFSDLLNGKAKDLQDEVDKLLTDIPQIHLVYENLPAEGSPYALRAAEDGVCVRKAKGDAAFYTYVHSVFSRQSQLTVTTLEKQLDAAIKEAGADPKSVNACAVLPATKTDVEASMALASAADVETAPTLVVNGRVIPSMTIPYDTLKRIIAYQAGINGVVVHVQPTLSNLNQN